MSSEPFSRDDFLNDGEWGAPFREIEGLVGGELVHAERQERWRPAWFFDIERDGERLPLYYRGDRGLEPDGVDTLRREMQVLQLLEAHGIPVPHIYGFCESLPGIVMERAPGRANLATADSEDERRAVLRHYLDLLAEIHRLPTSKFEALGCPMPQTAAERSLGDIPRWERMYQRGKNQPEPTIELILGWLRENVPTHRERVAPVVGDAGQFLFDQGRVTAVIDIEFAALSDPLADVGALLSRDLSEPLGDLSAGIQYYREITGEDFERDDLLYQAVRFMVVTPLSTCYLCAKPPPGLNLVQYESWNSVYGRIPLQLIAEIEGVEIESPDLGHPRDHRYGVVSDALVEMLRASAKDGDPYAWDTAARLAEYVRAVDQHGARFEAEDLDETAALLGRRPSDWRDADAALEQLAMQATRDTRPGLLRLLVRRTLRREALLGAAMRELVGAEAQRIELPPLG
ncbi:MAG: phosphotransferase family protein [Myxococcota bacterium]